MSKDKFTRSWIIENGIPIVQEYGGGLTLRALHYRLVAAGMTNTVQHYKRVIGAMTKARWEGQIHFTDFLDHDRSVLGDTKAKETDVDESINEAKDAIKSWATFYNKNRWENQEYYPEVFIEKKALQSVFQTPCRQLDVALCPCKGYPSLTYMYDASVRFQDAVSRGQQPIILYFGDYDPSGEDIPRSINDVIYKMGVSDIEVRRIALMEDQVVEWKLPPAPTKATDSRSAMWNGLGQVELDAVEPRKLQKLCKDSIYDIFDQDKYDDLKEREAEEVKVYKSTLKKDISSILD